MRAAVRRLGRRLGLGAALALAACASPVQRGDRLYLQGDLRGAVEAWRSVPTEGTEGAQAAARLADVQPELEALIEGHRERGAWFEERGRLAEAVLAYRLARQLAPGDREILDRVQRLARELAGRKAEERAIFEEALAAGELGRARNAMLALRRLDPFDAQGLGAERELEDAIEAELDRRLRAGREQLFAGDFAGAEASFRSVLRMQPDNESARGHLSYLDTLREIASQAGRPTPALPPPGLAASDAEIRAEGFYQNALAAERDGDPYTALRFDLAAVDARPGHPGAREHIERLRAQLRPRVEPLVESGRQAFAREDLQGALDRWRRALLIDPDNARAREWTVRAERLLANLERLRAEPDVGAGPDR